MQIEKLLQQSTEQQRPPDTTVASQKAGQPSQTSALPASGSVRRPVSYKQALNGNKVKRGFFSTSKQHTVRVDFSDFRGEANNAKDHFGRCFEGFRPQNYKKNSKKPAFELTFSCAEEVNEVCSDIIEYNGLKIHVQRGIGHKMLLRNVRVNDVPANGQNREELLQEVQKQLSQYGDVLEVKNRLNEQEKVEFWSVPDSNYHVQMALDQDFFSEVEKVPVTIDISGQKCKLDWYGKLCNCYGCGQNGHIKIHCPNKGKRTRQNAPKHKPVAASSAEKQVEKAQEIVPETNNYAMIIESETEKTPDSGQNDKSEAENIPVCSESSALQTASTFGYSKRCRGYTVKNRRCKGTVMVYDKDEVPYCRNHRMQQTESPQICLNEAK